MCSCPSNRTLNVSEPSDTGIESAICSDEVRSKKMPNRLMTSDQKGETLRSAEEKNTGRDAISNLQIELKNVSKFYRYPFGDVVALKSVSFEVCKGEFIAIIGSRGSGKSTLINIIGCIDYPTSGSISILNTSLEDFDDKNFDRFRIDNVSLVSPLLRLDPKKSIKQVLQDRLIFKVHTKSTENKPEKAMELAGIPPMFWETPVEELSDEIQLRGSIARALVTDPKIIVLDEPLKKCDQSLMGDILILLKKLNGKDITIIFATEDPLIAKRTSRQLWLHDGNLIEDKRLIHSGDPACDACEYRKKLYFNTSHNDGVLIRGKRFPSSMD